MKTIDTLQRVRVVILFADLLTASAPTLHAQATFTLSKNADFSTDDRVFERGETLYMQVTAPQIAFTDLDKNGFRLKPDEGGNDVRGVFSNMRLSGMLEASAGMLLPAACICIASTSGIRFRRARWCCSDRGRCVSYVGV